MSPEAQADVQAILKQLGQAVSAQQPVHYAAGWDESAHPRETSAQGGKRPGEFAPKDQGSNKSNSKNKADAKAPPAPAADDPYLLVDEQGRANVVVFPGQGEKGRDRKVYIADQGYPEAVYQLAEKAAGRTADDFLSATEKASQDLFTGEIEAEDAEVKADVAHGAFVEAATGLVDRLAQRLADDTEAAWGEDVSLADPAELVEAVDAARQKVEDAAYGVFGLFEDMARDEDADGDPDYLEENYGEAVKQAQKDLRYELGQALAAVSDAAHAFREAVETASTGRFEGWQGEAESAAARLNEDDYTPEDALDDAGIMNRRFADAGNPFRVWLDPDEGEWVHGDAEDAPEGVTVPMGEPA
jgi:hypothetical protein